VVTVQSIFFLEMHQNIFFYFLKIIFDISILKRSKNINFFILNKKINFFKNTGCITF
jgi:hypothetical protein